MAVAGDVVIVSGAAAAVELAVAAAADVVHALNVVAFAARRTCRG